MFTAIKLSNQEYAEIDLKFVQKYYYDIKDSWHVINDTTNNHTLTYNKSYVSPILTKGWSNLHKFNDFPDNVEVVFGYYGYNLFAVQMFKEVDNVSCIPKWHSRSTMAYQTMHFDTHVWENNSKNPMKPVGDDFGEFLKHTGIHVLTLCGDNVIEDDFEVYFLNDHKYTAQLGIKLNEFCIANNFKIGQKILFKFNLSERCICYVYPLKPLASTSNPSV